MLSSAPGVALERPHRTMRTRQTLTVGTDRFRVGPWQGMADVAYLAVGADPPRPSVQGLRTALDRLAANGFTQVVTAALHPSEAVSFEQNGFTELDRLLVLSHDLVSLDPPRRPLAKGLRVRWARPGDSRTDQPTAAAPSQARARGRELRQP